MYFVFFLMIRRPPRSTLDRSSAASDVYKRQVPFYGVVVACADDFHTLEILPRIKRPILTYGRSESASFRVLEENYSGLSLSLIHISEPTRPY